MRLIEIVVAASHCPKYYHTRHCASWAEDANGKLVYDPIANFQLDARRLPLYRERCGERRKRRYWPGPHVPRLRSRLRVAAHTPASTR